MTEPVAPTAEAATPPFRVLRLALGLVLGLLGHVVVVAAGFVAARTSSGPGGWEDLAALAVVLVLGEATIFLVSLVAGIVLAVRQRRDLGLGLVLGWAVGAVLFWLLVWAR